MNCGYLYKRIFGSERFTCKHADSLSETLYFSRKGAKEQSRKGFLINSLAPLLLGFSLRETKSWLYDNYSTCLKTPILF